MPQQPTQQPPYGGAPSPYQQVPPQSGPGMLPSAGEVEGAQYRVDHRDSNSLLSLRLPPGYQVKAKPGSMVAMDASVQIKGKLKVSFKKMFTGGEMTESIFTGPGEVLLAPETWGDIVPIRLDGAQDWRVGRDAFLACTMGVARTTKSQGFGKALFSGEGLFVYHVSGQGVMWVQSLGAITSRVLQPGEQWIVDNGHLVAWTAEYKVERISAGGLFSAAHTDEGLVCRNPETLGEWIAQQVPVRTSNA
uniref:Altered inheritance of mitochondria protein 24, mitochondrial n=1 Tax=Ganoderma boninense TaxID=34458 RepID=A0A5K1K4L6_9APHY|nr:Nucleoside-diphosphate-sugar epimerase [Ganoderma boninense]